MSLKVNAWATYEMGKPLKEYTYELGPLPDDYVDIKVTHSGVCYSDLAAADGELGPLKLPMVGGHEVAGVVHAIGKGVTNLKVGDRVGCHNVRSCCNMCPNCIRGEVIACHKMDFLVTGSGGFGEYIRMQAPFTYKLPDSLPNEYAASLMCAGATMWAGLRENNVRANDRVAILGIGGLGHLGLKFAKAMGCDVAAISTSKSKEEEARKLGAQHFIVSTDQEDLKKYQYYFDYIITTATAEIDYAPLCGLLRHRGCLIIAGLGGEKIVLPSQAAVWKGLRLRGVSGCSRKDQAEMIEFCGANKIYPDIEKLHISKINEAFEKVKKNTPRWRIVLTLDEK